MKNSLPITLLRIHLWIMWIFKWALHYLTVTLFTFNYHFVNMWLNANLIKVLVKPSIVERNKEDFSFHTSASHYLSTPEFIKLHLSSQMASIYLKHSFPPLIHYLACICNISCYNGECCEALEQTQKGET